ncbi:hypothetical protein [Streptomyces sp. NPDC057280]|uniref:hypothetical protein n=1 Tax=Streptomyces sp. NPDC057280 TaxID=3346081 RepID=UPI003641A10F
MAKTKSNCPDDLLKVQHALQAVCAGLAALFEVLPHSGEPMEAWAHPEGYWLPTSPTHPDSPGWTDSEQQQVAELPERKRELAAASYAGELSQARMEALKEIDPGWCPEWQISWARCLSSISKAGSGRISAMRLRSG